MRKLSLSVNIDVDDLEKGVAFYAAAVGLTPARRLGDFAVELAGAEVPVFLLHKPRTTSPFAGATSARDYARHWTPVHLDFLVEDAARALERAVAAGATAESSISSHEWGRMALMSDPFGNGFCLIEPEGPGYASIATPYVGR